MLRLLFFQILCLSQRDNDFFHLCLSKFLPHSNYNPNKTSQPYAFVYCFYALPFLLNIVYLYFRKKDTVLILSCLPLSLYPNTIRIPLTERTPLVHAVLIMRTFFPSARFIYFLFHSAPPFIFSSESVYNRHTFSRLEETIDFLFSLTAVGF